MARAGARRRPLLDRLPRPLHHDAGREVDPDEPQEPSVTLRATRTVPGRRGRRPCSVLAMLRHPFRALPRPILDVRQEGSSPLDTARRLAAERDASQSRSCCAGWASPSTRADGPLRSAVGSDGLTVCSPRETRVRGMAAITATCASTASRAPFLTFAPSRQAASRAADTMTSADPCPVSLTPCDAGPSACFHRLSDHRHPDGSPRTRATAVPPRPPHPRTDLSRR